jgi:outer membrane lipoprotein-sorting protein
MNDEARKLVAQIEATAAKVTSFVAEYDMTMHYKRVGLHSRGKLYYADKTRYRVEGITNGQRIVTVSRNDARQTYFIDQKVISQSNTIEDQSPIDLLHGLSDIRESFSSTDTESLIYVGETLFEGQTVYHFGGHFPVLPLFGFAKVSLPIEVDLFIEQATCLLRRRIWTETGKQALVTTNYRIVDINIPLEDSLFSIDVSSSTIRVVETIDVTKTLFFADDENQGASTN